MKQRPKGFALFMFRQDFGNVPRHRIRSSRPDFPVDSGKLIPGQCDGDLRSCHTRIIPLAVPGKKSVSLIRPTPGRDVAEYT
jgi:hypothetical protein